MRKRLVGLLCDLELEAQSIFRARARAGEGSYLIVAQQERYVVHRVFGKERTDIRVRKVEPVIEV